MGPRHLAGTTTHTRKGGPKNSFTHSVDYVLIDPEGSRHPWLFSRNRLNLMSVSDRDHGGRRGAGRGAAWAREILAEQGLDETAQSRLLLLTQPRFLGYVFNPVSFWLRMEGNDLVAVIAEVNNTFGDRHSYLCAHAGFAPIQPGDRIAARKVFHVSPFQEIAGNYAFRFAVSDDRIAIRIELLNGEDGLVATLAGKLAPLNDRAIIGALVRRPFGAVRTLALIFWHALRLKLKGATYRPRPEPPLEEISR
ncbi:MAG: DUF1365 domain-containing protein [Planctomycetes bacterium]|nr:DUF1365 domain-containing protein [Planctomycetota bacterium]